MQKKFIIQKITSCILVAIVAKISTCTLRIKFWIKSGLEDSPTNCASLLSYLNVVPDSRKNSVEFEL